MISQKNMDEVFHSNKCKCKCVNTFFFGEKTLSFEK